MTMISLDGHTLTAAEVMRVATGNAQVSVSPDAMPRIVAARSVVERILANDETVYGIHTVIGALFHCVTDCYGRCSRSDHNYIYILVFGPDPFDQFTAFHSRHLYIA